MGGGGQKSSILRRHSLWRAPNCVRRNIEKKAGENAYFKALLGYCEVTSRSFWSRNSSMEFVIFLKIDVNSDMSNKHCCIKTQYVPLLGQRFYS